MGTGARDRRVTGLRSAIVERCEGLSAAAAALGVTFAVSVDDLLRRDRTLGAFGQTISPNGSCRLLAAADGHIAINFARDDDVAAVAAWLDADIDGGDLAAVAARVAQLPVAMLRDRAVMLHLPFAVVGESVPGLPHLMPKSHDEHFPTITNLRVLDLSALWAGPLCGALLAVAGAQVVRWENPHRRDPSAVSTPGHFRALNGGKKMIDEPWGRDQLERAIASADVLITSGRPHALQRLGIEPDRAFEREMPLLWIAITAHGWAGDAAMRVGFGDDCAAAGGLVDYQSGAAVFIGDALADPLTGLEAARSAFEALAAGRGGLLDCALARTAAWYASRMKGDACRPATT